MGLKAHAPSVNPHFANLPCLRELGIPNYTAKAESCSHLPTTSIATVIVFGGRQVLFVQAW